MAGVACQIELDRNGLAPDELINAANLVEAGREPALEICVFPAANDCNGAGGCRTGGKPLCGYTPKRHGRRSGCPGFQKISTAEASRASSVLHAIPFSTLSLCNAGFQFTASDMIENDVDTHLPSSRRTLCKILAGATAWPLFADKQHNMFLALNSVLVNGQVGWPAFAKLAARTGFPGTDVMLKPAMQAGAAATKELLQGLKVRPAVFDFPVEFRKDDATFKEGLAKLGEQAQFAAAIDCPRMVTYIMPSSDTPKAELRATYKERFSACAKVLADSNVRLGLEFLGPLQFRKQFKYEFIWQMNEMLAFAEECGSNVGLLLDVWHWHHAGATKQDIVNAGKSRIVHVHFNDAPNLPPDQIRDNQRLLPGEGVIDLVGFLQTLQKIGYRDALSVEVFGRTKNMSPEEAAKAGLDASLAVFKKAGVPQG